MLQTHGKYFEQKVKTSLPVPTGSLSRALSKDISSGGIVPANVRKFSA